MRWIGAPQSDHPAPQVTLARSGLGAAAATTPAVAAPATGGDGDGLAIVALVVGGLGLLAGGGALVKARG